MGRRSICPRSRRISAILQIPGTRGTTSLRENSGQAKFAMCSCPRNTQGDDDGVNYGYKCMSCVAGEGEMNCGRGGFDVHTGCSHLFWIGAVLFEDELTTRMTTVEVDNEEERHTYVTVEVDNEVVCDG